MTCLDACCTPTSLQARVALPLDAVPGVPSTAAHCTGPQHRAGDRHSQDPGFRLPQSTVGGPGQLPQPLHCTAPAMPVLDQASPRPPWPSTCLGGKGNAQPEGANAAMGEELGEEGGRRGRGSGRGHGSDPRPGLHSLPAPPVPTPVPQGEARLSHVPAELLGASSRRVTRQHPRGCAGAQRTPVRSRAGRCSLGSPCPSRPAGVAAAPQRNHRKGHPLALSLDPEAAGSPCDQSQERVRSPGTYQPGGEAGADALGLGCSGRQRQEAGASLPRRSCGRTGTNQRQSPG